MGRKSSQPVRESVFGIFPEMKELSNAFPEREPIHGHVGEWIYVFWIFDQVPDDLKTLFQDYFYHQNALSNQP
jgi:hypothetical protein